MSDEFYLVKELNILGGSNCEVITEKLSTKYSQIDRPTDKEI